MEILPRTAEFLARREERQAALRQTLADKLPRRPDLVLEIGAGHGHFLTAYAEAHPSAFCVGIDLINERILRANRKRERRRLDNVLFLTAEASEFLECLPAGVSFATTFVLFPDPWPKRRHHKNRLLQPEFLNQLGQRVGEGGVLFFRTDDQPYFQDAQETAARHAAWELSPSTPWPFELATVFQARATAFSSFAAVKRNSLRAAAE